jgi:hypothetical protein
MIAITQELSMPLDNELPQTEETSLAHFCQFVDYYTSQSSDPLSTVRVCEQQAEGVRITPDDLTPENLRLVIETMLTAIDHLSKNWLDEQIQREDMLLRRARHLSQFPAQHAAQPSGQHGFKHLYHAVTDWMAHRLIWKKRVPQLHVSVS